MTVLLYLLSSPSMEYSQISTKSLICSALPCLRLSQFFSKCPAVIPPPLWLQFLQNSWNSVSPKGLYLQRLFSQLKSHTSKDYMPSVFSLTHGFALYITLWMREQVTVTCSYFSGFVQHSRSMEVFERSENAWKGRKSVVIQWALHDRTSYDTLKCMSRDVSIPNQSLKIS